MTKIYLRKRTGKRVLIIALACVTVISMVVYSKYNTKIHEVKAAETTAKEKTVEVKMVEPEVVPIEDVVEEVIEPDVPLASVEDINLLAMVTMAEAEGECEEGQRLVIDTVLNRVDSPYFPDTVRGVIYQTNAFEVMSNGRFDRCYVKEDIRKLVLEELKNRTNSEVVFFRTERYSDYGQPLFKLGNHYFSKY